MSRPDRWLCFTAALCALVLSSSPAHARTQAELFQDAIPYDAWPRNPNSAVRRLAADVSDNDGGLRWTRAENPPPALPPDGAGPNAVLVVIAKRFAHEDLGAIGPDDCYWWEAKFEATIIFDDGSKFFYQIMASGLDCPPPGGGARVPVSRTFSILHFATIGSGDDARIRSSVRQITNGQVVSTLANERITIGPDHQPQIVPTLALVNPAVPLEIAGATGSILDLRGHDGSTPLCTTAAPAVIRIGSVLMDPGVTIDQLFVPEPQVSLAQNMVDLRPTFTNYPVTPSPVPSAATFTLINLGNVSTAVHTLWSDTLGWTPATGVNTSVNPCDPQTFTIPLFFPPAGTSTLKTRLSLTSTALTSAVGGLMSKTAAHDIYFDLDDDADNMNNRADPCPDVPTFPTDPDPDGDFLPTACDPCTGFTFFPTDQCACGPADFNASGGLEVQDIFDFLNAWFAGDPAADFNGGGLGVSDIFDFLNAWFAGCG
ncbi:MAG TPA: GC-type dockerin domain-anchored protein [Phycisphaerales bacterium]|nr:GC-type dockerin domain-anchored protein [Phycisphaerales bacterium]